MISAIRDILREDRKASKTKYEHIRKIILMWCVKKKSCLDLYRDELHNLQSRCKLSSGCEVTVCLYVTMTADEDYVVDDADNGQMNARASVLGY